MARNRPELERLAAALASLTPAERADVLAATARRVRDADQAAGDAYRMAPTGPEEFTTDSDSLAWEAEGWDEFDPPRWSSRW